MHIDEQARLAALLAYRVLDSDREPLLDRLVALAAELFQVPIAAISLVDMNRQWFKAEIGVNSSQTPRDWSFCSHTIQEDDGLLVVEDALLDARFRENPLVTANLLIRFYAGAALTSPEGHNLGALCVIDTKPHAAPPKTLLEKLQILADLAMHELELARIRNSNDEKQRLLGLAEHMSGVGHWHYEIASDRITWSDEVYRIHGVTPGSFDPVMDDNLAFYHPGDQQFVRACVDRAIASGEGFEFQKLSVVRTFGTASGLD